MNNTNGITVILPKLLQTLVNNSPKTYHHFLHRYHQRIVKWIIEKTPLLNYGKHTFGERVYWVINNLTDFPSCKECGKKLDGKFYSVIRGYMTFCSLQCTNHNDDIHKQRLKTSINHFGKDNINNRKQAYQTMCDNYGVSCYFYANDFSEKSLSTIHSKYGNDITNVFQSEEIKQQSEQTKLLRYNDPHFINIEQQKQTVLNFSSMKKESIRQKHMTFYQTQYGVNFGFQVPEIKEKIRTTNNKNYGVDYPMQNSEFRRKSQKKYTYDNITFSSKPEIAYYIWLKDNNINFEYEPNISFPYIFNGKTKFYHPDFILKDTNQLIEIKGDQFFNSDGTMKNPFDQKQNEAYEAKHQCMLQNNVKILRTKDYIIYLNYIYQKYGKYFLKQFKHK